MTSRPSSSLGGTRGSAMLRLRLGFIVIAVVISFFGARLVQLQVIDPGAIATRAAQEGTDTVELPAERGAILDRNGTELATSVSGMMVIADPQMTRAKAPEIATLLSDELGLDYFETLERLRREGTRFQYLARRVPATKATAVVDSLTEQGYKGVSTQRDPIRDYPGNDVAANIVGFLGEDEPLAGLERTFNAQLAGTDGKARYQVGGGNRIPLGDHNVTEARDGTDLQLTLDQDVQWYAQRVLRNAVESSGSLSGTVVVEEVGSGELLALADYPTYDANKPLDGANTPEEVEKRKTDLGSRALSDPYEPGSVEKALTFASLLDQGLITPRTRITVPPELERAGAKPIGDHWDHDTIRLTAAGVLARSSNIGTVLAARESDKQKLADYLRAFGLGQRTDIGMRGESAGILPQGAWSDGSRDTIAFGQGLSVNAVQMAAAINTIANGGVHVDPSLIKGSATTDTGQQVGTDHVTTRRVVSEQAARDTAEMMELVPQSDGVAPAAAIPGYRVAGKTGTAQRVVDGRYDGSFTVSFAGFAPADAPRFTVYVVLHRPQNGLGGGGNAGPVFAKVMTYLLNKYGVPSTGTTPSTLPVEW
ncbi:peptidoglycan D,D-transpeptidase FtsI family protein [Nocardioides daejeonensis]|uniref:peptidoglycan D,D-transpeptidase FtsI family protein n=1 Tax=Nocardioides daejeonensis TaxID=1046556 RepID=UPI001EF73DB4|nr:penicillin-binding protein 2 [Nocardioides daejeonensis]